MADGSITIDVKVNGKEATITLNDLKKQLSETSQSAVSSNNGIMAMATSLGLVKIASKAINIMNQSLSGAISRYDTLQNYPRVMESLGYSAEDAQVSIKKLSDGIDGLPTTLDSIVGYAQQLTASLGDMDKATDTAIALNNMFLSGGQGAEAASRAFVQYNQMLAKGKVDQQSWNSLVEVAPGQMNQLAKAMIGTTATHRDLYSAIQSGQISFTDLNDVLIKLNSQGFGSYASLADQAKNATQGIATSIQNLKTSVVKGMAKDIEAIDNALKKMGMPTIAEMINSLKGYIDSSFDSVAGRMDTLIPKIVRLVEILKNIAPVVAIAFGAFASYKLGVGAFNSLNSSAKKMINVLSIMPGNFAGFKKSLADIGDYISLVIPGLASLGGGFVTLGVAGVAAIAVLGGIAAALIVHEQKIEIVRQKYGVYLDQCDKTIDKMDSLSESLTSADDKLQNQAINIDATADAAKTYVKALEETIAADNQSAEGKEQIKAQIEAINSLIPGLNLAYDEQTGKLNQNTQEIYANIDALSEQAKKEAEAEMLKQLYADQAAAVAALNTARAQYANNEKLIAAIEAEMHEYDNMNDYMRNQNERYNELINDKNALESKNSELASSEKELEKAVNEAAYAAENSSEIIKGTIQPINQTSNAVKAGGDAFSGYGSKARSGANTAISAINSVGSTARSQLGSLGAYAPGWGSDMAQGFANGVLSRMQAASNAVSSMAESIAAKLHFSRPDEGPLRNYEQWMPDFVEGLAKGIRDNIPILEGEALKMADALSIPTITATYNAATIPKMSDAGYSSRLVTVQFGDVNWAGESDIETTMDMIGDVMQRRGYRLGY